MSVTAETVSALEAWADECREIDRRVSTDEEHESWAAKADDADSLILRISDAPLVHDDDNDYAWRGEAFWLTHEGASVFIRAEAGRIVIETYPLGGEGDDAFDSATVNVPKAK
jgi:hypothetical protein